jgi:3',5'-cyclic-AMP phosphodiesterase
MQFIGMQVRGLVGMNRREFLKWMISGAVTMTTVLFGIPDVVLSPVNKIAPIQKHKAMAKDTALQIAVLTDLHIQDPKHSRYANYFNEKTKLAIQDVISLDPDIVLIVGDVTNHGYKEEYEIAKSLLRPFYNKQIPVYVTMGNHEFYNPKLTNEQARSLFLSEFQLRTPYQNIVKDNIHLVVLSPEYLAGRGASRDWARISATQLTWFENVLRQHQDKTTLVFLHQPLNNTVEQSQYEDWIARTVQTDALLEIVRENPQVKCWFSGHTHAPLTERNQIVFRHGIWFFGGASTYYTNDIEPINGNRSGPYLGKGKKKYDFHASQSRFIRVDKDKIIVQARDHQRRNWIKGLEHTVPI